LALVFTISSWINISLIMKRIWNSPDRIIEIYGTMIAVAMLLYFSLMYAMGLAHIIELRLLNIFIITASVYYALKQYARTHGGHLGYFKGLTIGVAASAIGVSMFAVALFIWLKLDARLTMTVLKNTPMGVNLNAYISCAAIIIEGLFTGFFAAYIVLNWLNTDEINNPTRIEETKGEFPAS
jgi:hypothetical protein